MSSTQCIVARSLSQRLGSSILPFHVTRSMQRIQLGKALSWRSQHRSLMQILRRLRLAVLHISWR